MHRIGCRRVLLAVTNAASGAYALAISGANDRAGTQTVLVLKRAFENVGDNFHVPMRVRGERSAGSNVVLVDDPQRMKAHPCGIVILVEGESVAGVEPAVVSA